MGWGARCKYAGVAVYTQGPASGHSEIAVLFGQVVSSESAGQLILASKLLRWPYLFRRGFGISCTYVGMNLAPQTNKPCPKTQYYYCLFGQCQIRICQPNTEHLCYRSVIVSCDLCMTPMRTCLNLLVGLLRKQYMGCCHESAPGPQLERPSKKRAVIKSLGG